MGLKDPQATIVKATFTCNSVLKNDQCVDTVLHNADDLQLVIKALKNTKPIEGILDISTDYHLQLFYVDQTVHDYELSLGFEHNARTQGVLIVSSDSHQGYQLSGSDTTVLRDIILKSTTFTEGLPKPVIQSDKKPISIYSGAYCISRWNADAHLVDTSCGVPQAPEWLNKKVKEQAISLAPQSEIRVDFPVKPAKIEIYMVKNGDRFPVSLDSSGKYKLPVKLGYVQYVLSATWNKDNKSDYYFGVSIR